MPALAKHAVISDTIQEQLAALLRCRDPSASREPADARQAVAQFLDGREPSRYGVWVHYPWSGSLVHVLPPLEYRELRLSRNRNKITAEEQETLLGVSIGIVGLSVGFSIAQTLVLEGIGHSFRLADFDELCLSNLNRVPIEVAALGVNKAVLAARRLYEIDPFLEVTVFPDGFDADTADAFFDGSPPLDLLVEECDDLVAKFVSREWARRRRIPVVMDTNDRGMLDVERFDLEPDRPILHGLFGETNAETLAAMPSAERLALVRRVIGDEMSDAMRQSMDQIGVSLVSWPQLGSGTTLGAALVSDVARRIFLGKCRSSGRFYVDPERLVCGDQA